MSNWVKYPFHVRHDGVDYNPGVPFKVEDPENHVLRGAMLVEVEAPAQGVESAVEAVETPRKTNRRKAAQ